MKTLSSPVVTDLSVIFWCRTQSCLCRWCCQTYLSQMKASSYRMKINFKYSIQRVINLSPRENPQISLTNPGVSLHPRMDVLVPDRKLHFGTGIMRTNVLTKNNILQILLILQNSILKKARLTNGILWWQTKICDCKPIYVGWAIEILFLLSQVIEFFPSTQSW